jgi:hypothetical protein
VLGSVEKRRGGMEIDSERTIEASDLTTEAREPTR